MIVMGVDPGYRQSAWVCFDGAKVIGHGIFDNDELLTQIADGLVNESGANAVVFEQIESFGMAVGREVFETVFQTGRMFQAVFDFRERACKVDRLVRRVIKVHLCQSARAQDSNIRAALMDRFGGLNAVGVKKSPGPLYGIKSHEWAALAVAVTWYDQHVNDGEEIRPGVAAQF